MNRIATFLMAATLLCLGASSCNKWLDVNENPNTATSAQAPYYQRLPWCQFYLEHTWEIPGSNAAYYTQTLASKHNQTNGAMNWNMNAANRGSNAQQWFFTGCATNLRSMYDDAMAAGAYHYAATAKLMRAFGFMEMVDLFGEIPYTDALGASAAPYYDTGDVVFQGCLSELEEAIELFGKTQADGAEPLATGDSWNGGNVDKWIKMCYLLKARWLVKLSKKQPGSYKEGKYDVDEILACLAKGPQSNSDDTVIKHVNALGSPLDFLWKESVNYSGVHSCIGQNNRHYWVSKALYDNLTDFAGSGVEDPRADKIIPWRRATRSADSPAALKWSADNKWMRSLGVDLTSSIFKDNGPAHSISFSNGKWTVTDPVNRQGDTVYVVGTVGYFGNSTDELLRFEANNDASAISGAFHLRADSPSVMASYAEACLIKAEVLFNRDGATTEAFEAYKNGIKANIEFMNGYLKIWRDQYGAPTSECPSFTDMPAADINNFLNNGIGTAADLTLGKIMTQKQILYLLTLEAWNDMRRYDYDPAVFFNFAKPYYYLNTAGLQDYLPLDKYPRRWGQASYELKYNTANLAAIGEKVPGALALPGDVWYTSKQIGTLPVWWDIAE